MDCNTARLYLQLGGTDAPELEAHLGTCTSCHHLAQQMRRLDEHLGRAMRNVEVPREPKQQLLYRLAAEDGDRQRRWMAYVLRGVSAAAAVLLLLWGVFALYQPARPVLSGDAIFVDFNLLRPDQDSANAKLKQLGSSGRAPSFVNYALLCGEPSLAILPGTQDDRKPARVPQFFFALGDKRAIIYVVSRRDYRIEEVENPDPAYPWQLQIEQDEENPSYDYLIFHTGKDWNWLRAPVGR